ncbi:MAG: restriction endonuclease subunit S, partial [Lacrimispora saccharolytica]
KKDKHESVIFRRDNSYYEKLNGVERCIDDEIPFDIPKSWEWIRHNEIFEISGGSQPPKSKFITEKKDGYVRLYQIRDYGSNPVPVYIPANTATKTTHKGDILLARYGASLGKVFIAEDGAYNVAMAKVIPLFSGTWIIRDFMLIYYQSELYQSVIHKNSRSAQAGFNKEDLSTMLIPIPPVSEQKRIVKMANTLISLTGRLRD